MNQQSWIIKVGWPVAHFMHVPVAVAICIYLQSLRIEHTLHSVRACLLRWTMSIGCSCCSVTSTASGRSTRLHPVCIHLHHLSVCNPCMYMLTAPYLHMQPSAPLHACHARHILAAGVLDPDDKKPQEEFQEMRTVGGIPELPEGYMITEWLRLAAPSLPI